MYSLASRQYHPCKCKRINKWDDVENMFYDYTTQVPRHNQGNHIFVTIRSLAAVRRHVYAVKVSSKISGPINCLHFDLHRIILTRTYEAKVTQTITCVSEVTIVPVLTSDMSNQQPVVQQYQPAEPIPWVIPLYRMNLLYHLCTQHPLGRLSLQKPKAADNWVKE